MKKKDTDLTRALNVLRSKVDWNDADDQPWHPSFFFLKCRWFPGGFAQAMGTLARKMTTIMGIGRRRRRREAEAARTEAQDSSSLSSSSSSEDADEFIHLVYWNGIMESLQSPVNCCEILHNFPKHSLCHSSSFIINRKTAIVPAAESLKEGNMYFLLPSEFFDVPFTLPSLLSLAMASTTEARPGRRRNATVLFTAHSKLFQIESPSIDPKRRSRDDNALRIRVSPEFVISILGGEDDEGLTAKAHDPQDVSVPKDDKENTESELQQKASKICDSPILRKEYGRLVTAKRKPVLETIIEESPFPNGNTENKNCMSKNRSVLNFSISGCTCLLPPPYLID